MSNPVRQNLTIYQGDDWAVFVDVTNPDSTPADLTGYTPKAQLRRKVADQDDTVDVELDVLLDTSSILLSMPHTVTEGLSGSYAWDVQVTDTGGGVTTLMYGTATVQLEVTR